MDGKQLENIAYLNQHFLSQERVLNLSGWTLAGLEQSQRKRIVPMPSYSFQVSLNIENPLKPIMETYTKAYYPLGILGWLSKAKMWISEKEAFQHFEQRYRQEIESLKKSGWKSQDATFSVRLNRHIQEEWTHFLKGTYGICTKNGTPEEIAIKSLGLHLLGQTWDAELGDDVLAALDACISPFPPGQYQGSSRQKLDQFLKNWNQPNQPGAKAKINPTLAP